MARRRQRRLDHPPAQPLAHRALQLPAPQEQDDGGSLLAAAALDLARSELARQSAQERAPRPWPDDEWDGWAHVHAALSLPEVVLTLPSVLTRDDTAVLQGVQAQGAHPVRSWLATLVDRAPAAA